MDVDAHTMSGTKELDKLKFSKLMFAVMMVEPATKQTFAGYAIGSRTRTTPDQTKFSARLNMDVRSFSALHHTKSSFTYATAVTFSKAL